MSQQCFYYTETKDTANRDVTKIQCFCGTTACNNLPTKLTKKVCRCCLNIKCDYSTVGCPWYIDEDELNTLLEMLR